MLFMLLDILVDFKVGRLIAIPAAASLVAIHLAAVHEDHNDVDDQELIGQNTDTNTQVRILPAR